MTEKEFIEILKNHGEMISLVSAETKALRDHYTQHVAPIIGKSEDEINKELDVLVRYNYDLTNPNP